MVSTQKIFGEPFVYGWLILGLVAIALLYNQALAFLFGLMVLADFMIWFSFKPQLNFNSVSGNSAKALAVAMMSYIIFRILYKGVELILTQQNLLRLWSSTNPVFASSKIFDVIVFGFIIAMIETRLTIRMLEAISIVLRDFGFDVNTRDWKNVGVWIVSGIISIIWVWFHLTAKGVSDNTALASVFIFFFISCIGAVFTQEMESMVELHIINNAYARMATLFGG